MSLSKARTDSLGRSMLAIYFFQGTLGTVMIPRIPQLIDQLDVNFTVWGAIIGFSGLGGLIGLMFASNLIVRFGSRRILQVSALAFAFLLMPMPYISNGWIFFLDQAAIAFAGACLNVALNAQAVVLQKFLNRVIIPKFHGVWSIGAASSAALSAFMVSFTPMWLQFLIVPGVIALALGLLARRVLSGDEIGKVSERKLGEKVPFWRSPAQLWIISLGWFAGVFPEAAVMDWSTVFGRKMLMLDAALSAVPYTFFVVAMILSRLSVARVTRRIHVGILSFWGGLVGAAAMGIGAIFGPMISTNDRIAGMFFTSIFWFVAGIGIGPMSPNFTTTSGQIKGLSTSQGLARASLISSVLILGAKVIMGAIAQNVNLTVAFMLPTALFFMASIILGISARGHNKERPVVEDAFPITGSIAIVRGD